MRSVGDRSGRVTEPAHQPQLGLIERWQVSSANVGPAVRHAFRDPTVAGIVEDAVDFERCGIQVKLLDVVRGLARGKHENVADRSQVAADHPGGADASAGAQRRRSGRLPVRTVTRDRHPAPWPLSMRPRAGAATDFDLQPQRFLAMPRAWILRAVAGRRPCARPRRDRFTRRGFLPSNGFERE